MANSYVGRFKPSKGTEPIFPLSAEGTPQITHFPKIPTTIPQPLPEHLGVILHLSDLHFDGAASKQEKADRKRVLRALVKTVANVEDEWKPTIICVTGDIGWRAATEDYDEAREWFDGLLGAIGLDYGSMVLSPGNHDLYRQSKSCLGKASDGISPRDITQRDYPLTADEADEMMSLDNEEAVKACEKRFQAFTDFCRKARVRPFKYSGQENYLIGACTVDRIKFVSCNTAAHHTDDKARGRLWASLPVLQNLQSSGELSPVWQDYGGAPVVGLFHHPPAWLHDDEITPRDKRPAALDYLAERCHVILAGHTHGMPRDPDVILSRCYLIVLGPTYVSAKNSNSFQLLKVGILRCERRVYQFNPGAPIEAWELLDERRLKRRLLYYPVWQYEESLRRRLDEEPMEHASERPGPGLALPESTAERHASSRSPYIAHVLQLCEDIEALLGTLDTSKAYAKARELSQQLLSSHVPMPVKMSTSARLAIGRACKEYVRDATPGDREARQQEAHSLLEGLRDDHE